MSISVNNAGYLVREVVTHKRKVLSLYKKAIRDIESWKFPDRAEARYHAVLMRHRFDQNKDIKDMRIAKKLLKEGEDEYWRTMHPQPIKFTYSPGGVCFERYLQHDDVTVDYWHPLEKAQYPFYFARREQRKLEYKKLYEEEYGNAEKNLGVEKTVDYHKLTPDVKKIKEIED